MKSTIHSCVFAASLAVATIAFAQVAAPAVDSPATEPKPKPDITPQQQKIADLIKQLGADDFAKRDEASDELQKMGVEALPALREALRNDDPSVRSYAEWLVPKMEGRRDPRRQNAAQFRGQQLGIAAGGGMVGVGGAGGGGFQLIGPRNGRVNVNVAAANGLRVTNINDGQRQINIQEDADGIRMTVTENKDGKQEQKEYKAKSIEDLRKDSPEAAQIYDQYTARGRGLNAANARILRLTPDRVGNDLDVQIRQQLQDAQKFHEKAMIDQQVQIQDFLKAANGDLADIQNQNLRQRLKAETEQLERQLADVEAMHKRLLERTKAAQQRLAELEKQQEPQPEKK